MTPTNLSLTTIPYNATAEEAAAILEARLADEEATVLEIQLADPKAKSEGN